MDVADLMSCNGLLPALECGWADAAVGLELGTNSFRPPPHHTANPCAGAVPQELDAQTIELGTCLWAHGPLITSHHFPPWQLWAFLMGVYCSIYHDD